MRWRRRTPGKTSVARERSVSGRLIAEVYLGRKNEWKRNGVLGTIMKVSLVLLAAGLSICGYFVLGQSVGSVRSDAPLVACHHFSVSFGRRSRPYWPDRHGLDTGPPAYLDEELSPSGRFNIGAVKVRCRQILPGHELLLFLAGDASGGHDSILIGRPTRSLSPSARNQ